MASAVSSKFYHNPITHPTLGHIVTFCCAHGSGVRICRDMGEAGCFFLCSTVFRPLAGKMRAAADGLMARAGTPEGFTHILVPE